ncbi:MAG: hypothetical protein Q4B26_05535 [Eubacteriales bacterium]|nr:hypothetical protein [Eubacteriales bacterium]
MTEIDKLAEYLRGHGYEFKRHTLPYGSDQIVVWNDKNKKAWDAVCGKYSYGGTNGLIETMGMPEDKKGVTGWLTAQDIIDRLEGR